MDIPDGQVEWEGFLVGGEVRDMHPLRSPDE